MSDRSRTLGVMQMPAVVTVDVAAAAAKPSLEAITAWAGGQRAFVSSVMDGMAEERQAVVRGIEEVGAEPVWFEGFGGRDDDAQAAYLSEVASSTVYVGVLDRAYGRLLGSRRSATHEEYREAERRGLRVSAWARSDGDLQGDQVSFLDEIRQFHVTGSYATADELGTGVAAALRRIAAEELSPWCMVGDAVFRARSVEDDGASMTVHASVHDQAVLAALEELRPHQWGGTRDTWVTWAGRSFAVRPRAIRTTTTTSRATEVVLQLDRSGDRQQPGIGTWMGAMNANGRTYTASDLTAIALRKGLFDEPSPSGLMGMGHDFGDLTSRVPAGLSTETFRAVLSLIITEALVSAAQAGRVTRIQVSPPGPIGRRVLVEWMGATAHGQAPTPGVVDGHIQA